MKKILTEGDLRAAKLPQGLREYTVDHATFVTPSALEFLRERGIALVRRQRPDSAVMSHTPIVKRGDVTYIDAATGKGYRQKPEEMTHLRGNLLVPKTHPRILLRGKLDSLQAQVLEAQVLAYEQRLLQLVEQLDEVLTCTREILAAEVKDTPLKEQTLFGLTPHQLRHLSHNIHQETHLQHPVPHYTMGKMAVALNSLRAQVRETELAAAQAFSLPGEQPRPDIILALNRLSSGVYILFCRLLADHREV